MGVVTKEQLEHGMDYEVFIQTFGNVIEHCQLCAAAVWAEQPFKSLMDLHAAICRFVDELPPIGDHINLLIAMCIYFEVM